MQLRINLNLHVTVLGLFYKTGEHTLVTAKDTIAIQRKNSSNYASLTIKRGNKLIWFKVINQSSDLAKINNEILCPEITVPIFADQACQKQITKILEILFPIQRLVLEKNEKIPRFFSRGTIVLKIKEAINFQT
ncbi:MAG: hypothetical protein ACOZAJ_02700 [Patescibacteria group bacterium]